MADSIKNQHGRSWVYVPGKGRVSYSELNNMVQSGEVEETVRNPQGEIISRSSSSNLESVVDKLINQIVSATTGQKIAPTYKSSDYLQDLAAKRTQIDMTPAEQYENSYRSYNSILNNMADARAMTPSHLTEERQNYYQNLINTPVEPQKVEEDRARQDWLQKNQLDMSYGQALESATKNTMDEEESKTYNDIFNARGREAAEEYFKEAKPDLQRRYVQKNKDYWKEQGETHPVETSIASVVSNKAKALEYLYRLAQKATTGKIDENDPMGVLGTDMTNYGREGVSNAIEKNAPALLDPVIRQEMTSQGYSEPEIQRAIIDNHNNNKTAGQVGKFLYSTGMSMADFLTDAAFASGIRGTTEGMGALAQKLGDMVALTPMGLMAAQDATITAREQGMTEEQALIRGALAGVIEMATEMFSVEALLNPSKSLMKNKKLGYFFKNALAEGGEEAASDIANELVDEIMHNDKSEIKLRMKELMGQNNSMSKGQAYTQAMLEQIAPDFLGGFLSGGVMGGIGAKFNSYHATQMIEDLKEKNNYDLRDPELLNSIIESQLEEEEKSLPKEIAQNLKDKIENGEQIEDAEIAGLIQAIDEDENADKRSLKEKTIGSVADVVSKAKTAIQNIVSKSEEPQFDEAQQYDEAMGEMYNSINPVPVDYRTNLKPSRPQFYNTEEGIKAYDTANPTTASYSNTNAERLSAESLRERLSGAPVSNTIEELTADMPANEQYVMSQLYDNQTDPYEYVTSMREYEIAGLEGRDINTVQSNLNEAQAKAAYELGRSELNEIRLRESGERANSEGARTELQTVEPSTGRNQARQAKVRGSADTEISKISVGETVSRFGNKEYTEDTPLMADARNTFPEDYSVHFVQGLMNVDGKLVRGVIDTDNKEVWIQADHPVFNSLQLAKHEDMHRLIDEGKVDIAQVKRLLEKRLGKEKVRQMLDDYGSAYIKSGLTDAQIMEEIICDANGGMNIFVEANDILARKFAPQLEAVKEETKRSQGQPNAPPKTDNRALKLSEESESLAQLRKENKQLQKEVESFKAKLSELESQMNSKPRKVQYRAAQIIAKDLLSTYASDMPAEELTKKIAELGEYVLNESRNKKLSAEEYYDSLKQKALDIASDIMLSSKELSDKSDYNDIRKVLDKGISISPQDRENIPEYDKFFGENIGNIKITNSGVPVNKVYDKLSEMFSWYFPSDITDPAEQLMQIADVVNNVKPYYNNTYEKYGYTLSEIAEYMANEIISESAFGQMGSTTTVSDKINALKKENKDKIAKINAANKAKTQELIEKYKADKDKAIQNLKDNYKRKDKTNKEKRQAKILREKIDKHVQKLSQKVLNPTKTSHITEKQDPKMESLRSVTAKVLSLINMESAFMTATVWDENQKRYVEKRVKSGSGDIAFNTKKTEAWRQLQDAYDKIAKDSNYLSDEALEGTDGWIADIAKLQDTPISELGAKDLEKIYNCLRSLEATLTLSDKALAIKQGATIANIVYALKNDNENLAPHKNYGIKSKGGTNPLDFLNHVSTEMLTPEAFFHRLGVTGDELFRALRNGQDNSIRFYQNVMKWIDDNITVDVDKADHTNVSVKLGGKERKISLTHLMELYVLSQRKQARQHILTGGINLLNSSTKNGILTLTPDLDIENITPDELDGAVLKFATAYPEYKKLADAMQKYASEELAKYGNEASMRVYGYEKFNEDNYWKIRVDKKSLNSAIDNYNNNVTTVGNKGMSKPTNPDAKQPIYIDNIFHTFLNQVVEMGDYGSYLEVTEDMNRILNFRNNTANTKNILQHVLGTTGERYWLDLMRDVSNSGVANEELFGGIQGMAVGIFKAGAVGGNLRVVVQQPTAILRAMETIDGKYIAAGTKNPLKGSKKAIEHAPIAWWKDKGYYDINTGRSLWDLLYNNPNVVRKASELLMRPAGMADNFAWGILWNAVEAETKDTTDLKVGSDEYYDHCVKRFTEIIDKTQVVDGVLQRAGVLRKKGALSKMATAFMGEPIKQLNQWLDAWYDMKTGRGSKKMVAKTATSLLSAAALNAVVKSLVDAMRHSSRDKDYWERFVNEFWGLTGEEKDLGEKFMSGFINGYLGGKGNAYEIFDIPQYIPFLRDLESFARGYDVYRSDLSVAISVKKAWDTFWQSINNENKKTAWSSFATLAGEITKFAGVPLGNVMRDFYSAINSGLNDFGSDYALYQWNKLFYNIDAKDAKGTLKNKSMYMDMLYDAWANDRTEDFNLMYEDMKKHFTPKDFQDAFNKRMEEEQGTNDIKKLEGVVNFKTGDIGKHVSISKDKKAQNEKETEEKKQASEEKKEKDEELETLYNLWAKGDPSFDSMYNDMKNRYNVKDFQDTWDKNMREEQGVSDVKDIEGRVSFRTGEIGEHTAISPEKKAENERIALEKQQASEEKSAKKIEAENNFRDNPTYNSIKNSAIWNQATPAMRQSTEDTIVKLMTGQAEDMQAHIDVAKKHGISESKWLMYHLAWQIVDASNYSKQFGKGGANGSADDKEREKAARMVGMTLAQVKAINKEVSNAKKQTTTKTTNKPTANSSTIKFSDIFRK